ncbi:MAG: 1,4-dihydroxy-2-naphthoate polyprenyltransferase [Bacteroidota bacterium]
MKSWISAMRPRTLPLALACIGMGAFLAADANVFRWSVFGLSALTTVLLQILSNLANDYGDSQHGADSDDREGPQRAVQTGAISAKAMRRAIALFVVLCLASGVTLLYASLGLAWETFGFFFVLGLLSIGAAITYTASRKPYGYVGLGDLSVIIFFGIVAVLGSSYLYQPVVQWGYLLPALSCGFFATAVLNVNNIRDIESDKKAGKRSIPVRIGRKAAVGYHTFLLVGGLTTAGLYTAMHWQSPWQLLFLVAAPLLFINGKAVATKTEAKALDPFLKQMALTTLLFVLTFGIGLLLG